MNPHAPALALLLTAALAPPLSGAKPSFEAQTIDANLLIGYGLAIGDVDGDGDEDILVADKRDFWWYENPSWKRHLFHSFHQGEARTSLRDNVCIAVRDLDGDGKVEVAVGGNWNPGETTDLEKSGSVHFLGSLGRVKPVQLPHDPTTHRMRWVSDDAGQASLVVLPLHGKGNRNGEGEGVLVKAYSPPKDPFTGAWKTAILNDELHKTHNFDSLPVSGSSDHIVVGAAEGARIITSNSGKWSSTDPALPDMNGGAGEIRIGRSNPASQVFSYATIEPMHGNTVAWYEVDGTKGGKAGWKRTVLDESLAQGHALAVADVLGTGDLQVIAGWRNPDRDKKVGIKLYARGADGVWVTHLIDDNTMACEDLKVADLNADGKPDLIACGRSTRNLIIYWNR